MNSVDITVNGGAGGVNTLYESEGGTSGVVGGQESGTLAVTTGEQLTIVAGGSGELPSLSTGAAGPAAYGGGGLGGTSAGGGGGGSFVFGPGAVLLIAAGGGGGEPTGNGGGGGKGGGTAGGMDGFDGGVDSSGVYPTQQGLKGTGATGGGGGSGGAGGTTSFCGSIATAGTNGSGPASGPTVFGSGGPGGSPTSAISCVGSGAAGGGGGGGYFGGGGGGGGGYNGGGGGGGSGYASPLVTNQTSGIAAHPTSGSVTISYQAPDDVSISAGNPVPEPASGSVPATFTISLPAAQASPVTIGYKTIDGTATTAAHAYTAVPDGSVTIPAGQTSSQIQVQIDDGSGQATTQTEGFQVQLTSSSGPPISTADGSATGVILVPGIAGKLTDEMGNAQAAHPLTLTGTASSGQAVTQHLVTDGGGRYQLYADSGTYTLTPDPPASTAGKPSYEPVGCPGVTQPGACTRIALNPGANLTIDFKLLALIVNSTDLDQDPQSSLAQKVCDTTPAAATQTCTLPAALDVADALGPGQTIGFDIPTSTPGAIPVISTPYGLAHSSPAVAVSVDGTTQPGSHRVEIMNPTPNTVVNTVGLEVTGQGASVRGLVINGFSVDLEVGAFLGFGTEPEPNPDAEGSKAWSDVPAPGAGWSDVTIQNDVLGATPDGRQDVLGGELTTTILAPNSPDSVTKSIRASLLLLGGGGATVGGPSPGEGNVIAGGDKLSDAINIRGSSLGATGALVALNSPGNVIQGNTIRSVLLLDGGGSNTVGGAVAGAGNNVSEEIALNGETDDTVQGNVMDQLAVGASHTTIGGATSEPGTGAGNTISTTGTFDFGPQPGVTVRGDADVVQGNRILGWPIAVDVYGQHTTVGGATSGLGNLIVGEGSPGGAGVAFEEQSVLSAGTVAADNVVSHNQITGFRAGDGVLVKGPSSAGGPEPVGDTVTANEMSGDGVGINLGGGPFLYDSLSTFKFGVGPNHLQPYPLLFAASKHGGTRVMLGLQAPRGRYTIELYSQPSCAQDSITPGEGKHSLGQRTINVGFVQSVADLTFDPAHGAVTATATAADGSTSEFSPCLTIGHKAPPFARQGVSVPNPTVNVQKSTASASSVSRARDARATAKKKTTRLIATLRPFCPPVTTGSCAGTLVLRLASGGRTLARITLRLAPGQLGTLHFDLPAAAAKLVERRHAVAAIVTVNAHDGGRHPLRRRSARTIVLRLA